MTPKRILLIAAGTLVAPAAASANVITEISTGSPRAEVPAEIVVRGSAIAPPDDTARIFVVTRASGGPPCAAEPLRDPGRSVEGLWSTRAEGAFAATGSTSFRAAGSYVVCAWIADSQGGSTLAAAHTAVTVAAPRGRISIKAPRTVRAGRLARLVVVGASDAERQVVVYARPSRGPGACGVAPVADRGEQVAEVNGVLGEFRHPFLLSTGAATGITACAWLVRHFTDAEPIGVARRFIRVVGRRPPAPPIFLE